MNNNIIKVGRVVEGWEMIGRRDIRMSYLPKVLYLS